MEIEDEGIEKAVRRCMKVLGLTRGEALEMFTFTRLDGDVFIADKKTSLAVGVYEVESDTIPTWE